MRRKKRVVARLIGHSDEYCRQCATTRFAEPSVIRRCTFFGIEVDQWIYFRAGEPRDREGCRLGTHHQALARLIEV
jgi:hypothetical protein